MSDQEKAKEELLAGLGELMTSEKVKMFEIGKAAALAREVMESYKTATEICNLRDQQNDLDKRDNLTRALDKHMKLSKERMLEICNSKIKGT